MATKLHKFLLLSTLLVCNFAKSELVEISDTAEFDKYLENSDKPVMVEFHGESWCPPCKAVKKHITDFANKHKHINIVKIDVDKNKDLSQRYAVGGLPTFLFFEVNEKQPNTHHTIVGGNASRIEDKILSFKKDAPETKTEGKKSKKPDTEIVQHKPAKKAAVTKTAGKLVDLQSKEEFDALISSGPVVVELKKDNCHFCTFVEKPMEDLAKEMPNVSFTVINKDDCPELVSEYEKEIKGYPTFLVFKDGKFVTSFGGASENEESNLRILRGRVSSALGGSGEVVVSKEVADAAMASKSKPQKSKNGLKSKRSRASAA
jgi:thioredoxin 1